MVIDNPLVIVALVFLVLLALFGLAELWFRWSFRRDAMALAVEHAWRQHARHRTRRDPACPICGDEAHKKLGVPITDVPHLP